MIYESTLSVRERPPRQMLPKRTAIHGLLIVITVCLLSIAGGVDGAYAQASDSENFTPQSWQPGAEQRSRARSARRSVTISTELEDFDVPRRNARRATASSGSRVVARARTAKRVRVAALTNVGASEAAPRRAVQRRAATGTRVAALGNTAVPRTVAPAAAPRSLTGGSIAWRASSGCLAGNLRSVLSVVAANYGRVTVNSTCRSPSHNRRVGGARKSWHLTGNAADFRVHGAAIGRLYAYLRGSVGGLKHYGGGRFHIDNGPKRTF